MSESQNAAASAATCPECGAGLVNIVTGAVCPNGHAGLHPHVSAEDNRRAKWSLRVAALPAAATLGELRATAVKDTGFVDSCIYVVMGEPGVFRRVRRFKSSLHPADGNLLAKMDDTVVELTPWEWANTTLREAMRG